MDDLVRDKLKELVRTQGLAICDDPVKFEQLMQASIHGCTREILLLSMALKSGVVKTILEIGPVREIWSTNSVLVDSLISLLNKKYALNEGAARWVIESWMTAVSSPLPNFAELGKPLVNRPLHFIWIIDSSRTMRGEKMHQLNYAIRETLPEFGTIVEDNPNMQLTMGLVTFSTGAWWQMKPIPFEYYEHYDLTARGDRDMGQALSLVADYLRIGSMPTRALPPVLVLIAGGNPTDNFQKGLDDLMAQPWGKKATRIGVAVGSEIDTDILQQFIGNPDMKPLEACNVSTLVKYMNWNSTQISMDW